MEADEHTEQQQQKAVPQQQQQQLFDIESAHSGGCSKEHLRQLGMSKLDAVLSKAQAGQDPWEYQQRPKRAAGTADELSDVHDADVAAMGLWLERNRPMLLSGGLVLAQGASWVLIKGSLMAMHTPAVLTFLHLLTAALMQLLLVWWGGLPPPQLSAAAAKGAALSAAITALQLLLVMWALEHASVFLLLCWVTVVPLLLGVTRAADVAKRRWLVALANKQLPWLAVAAAGLVFEVLLDRNAHSIVAFVGLVLWSAVCAADMVWQQLKVDATLGHLIMEPDFLFRARELSDLEEALSPSSRALLTAALPALPVLVVGLVSLEAKDLVDHEPSVPTLEALLLSCLAFGAVHNLSALVASCLTLKRSQPMLLQSAAAVVAVVLELLKRPTSGSGWGLIGVTLSVAGGCCSHLTTAERLQHIHRG